MLHYCFRFQVTDSKHEILAQKDDINKGKFTVVVESHDAYEICFKSRAPHGKIYFTLEWKRYVNLTTHAFRAYLR